MASFNFTLTSSIIDGAVTKSADPITFIDTSINQSTVKDINIAAGATDAQISLDGLTAKHIELRFNATVTVKLNGSGNTPYTLTPSADNPAAIVVIGGAITSVFVTNPGASPVECKMVVAAA